MNASGIKVIEYNVLVDQDVIDDQTTGGLWKPDGLKEQEKHGQTTGVLIALSPMAFAFDDWPEGEEKPKVGDRVFFAKHSGAFVEGADGKEYRVIKDKDVIGVMA